MIHLLRNLPSGARVLDLGAGPGSFPAERQDIFIVRLDIARPHRLGSGSYVLADAARLPFAAGSFHLVVSNHSLEHFPQLEATLREAGRVLASGGALYVAVPDASTFTDRVYRWLGRGGGHVNPFRSPLELAALVARLTGLTVQNTTVLFSSLSFLNSHNFVSPPPRRIALFAGGNEHFLAVLIALLRAVDRRWNTRWSRYGWAFRFGNVTGAEPPEVWVNVCVRCGSGHSAAYLRKHTQIRKLVGMFAVYSCPACGGFNFLTREFIPPAP